MCTQDALTFISTCVITQVLWHTLHSVCSHKTIHPSLAVSIIVQMELDGFQTLLQQGLILCSTLPYSGGRDHGDQRPKACKHEWDQSPWMTSTVRMEIKHPSFRFVRLSGPFYRPNPRHLELCLPHLKLHPAADHTRRAHLMVTAGMSGFSAWFVPNAASCNCQYSRWVNVSQTSSGWTDTRRHGVRAEIQPLYSLYTAEGRTRGEVSLRKRESTRHKGNNELCK